MRPGGEILFVPFRDAPPAPHRLRFRQTESWTQSFRDTLVTPSPTTQGVISIWCFHIVGGE